MFQINEVVLYKMVVARITQIQKEGKQSYFLLESFGEEPWHFKVPVENVYEHIQQMPSKEEVEEQINHISTIKNISIQRTSMDKFCKELLESTAFKDWMMLMKALLVDKRTAELAGKKFILKEKGYLDAVTKNVVDVVSYVLQISYEEAEGRLLDAFEVALDEV